MRRKDAFRDGNKAGSLTDVLGAPPQACYHPMGSCYKPLQAVTSLSPKAVTCNGWQAPFPANVMTYWNLDTSVPQPRAGVDVRVSDPKIEVLVARSDTGRYAVGGGGAAVTAIAK